MTPDEPLDVVAVARDDDLLDALAAGEAVHGDAALHLLTSMRAGLEEELRDERFEQTAVLPLVGIGHRRARRHVGRLGVATIVTLGALSLTGAAAALSTSHTPVLGPIHRLLDNSGSSPTKGRGPAGGGVTAEPAPTPSEDDHGGRGGSDDDVTAGPSASTDDHGGGSGSDDSNSSGSNVSGSGSDGSGSDDSGSDSSGKGSGGDDQATPSPTPNVDDHGDDDRSPTPSPAKTTSGSGGGGDDSGSGSSGSGSGSDGLSGSDSLSGHGGDSGGSTDD
jgi:hypothetical protein